MSSTFRPTGESETPIAFDHQIQRHQREANLAIAQGSSAQIEIQLGHLCNNRCVFCISGQLTADKKAQLIEAEPVFEILRSSRDRGCTKVTFLGGEPSLQPSFVPALKLAVELGYQEIVLFSNGVRMHRSEYIDELLDIGGKYEWRFSLQGATEAEHDEVVGRRGAFARILKAMTYLRSKGERITANMCITAQSMKGIPAFVPLCREMGIEQLHIDQVRPADAGRRTEEEYRAMIPIYRQMAPYFDEMLSGLEAWSPGFDVNVGNYPYCLLPQWSHRIHHDGLNTFTYAATSDSIQPAFNKYPQKKAGKFHRESCDECVFRQRCNGIFEYYDYLYGSEEFEPIAAEELHRLDIGQHAFIERNQVVIDALSAHPLPRGLQFGTRSANAHDAVWTMNLDGPDGTVFSLHLCRDEDLSAHLGHRFGEVNGAHLRGTLPHGVDPRTINRVMGWLVGLDLPQELRIRWGAEPAQLALDAWRISFDPNRFHRAQQALSRAMAQLSKHHSLGDWKVLGTDSLRARLGDRVDLVDSEGRRMGLILEMDPRPENPLVRVSTERHRGSSPEMMRSVLDASIAVIQG